MATIRRTRRPARKPGATAAAGYGGPHQKLRRQWEQVVAAGQAFCHSPVCLMPYGPKVGRRIPPGTPWDLDHKPGKHGYRGPSHSKCNRAEGWRMVAAKWKGKRPPRMRTVTSRQPRMSTSRQW